MYKMRGGSIIFFHTITDAAETANTIGQKKLTAKLNKMFSLPNVQAADLLVKVCFCWANICELRDSLCVDVD